MESSYLKCLVCVIERGSIAEAARYLDIAPATVAQRLKALEADVGCHLLQRTGRTVKPTVAGSRILPHAYAMLSVEDEIRSAASNTDLPPGPLRLGAIPTVFFSILPEILNAWVARYPNIPVFIDPAVTILLHTRLVDGDLDVALLAHPNYSLPKIYCWQSIIKEELVLLAPKKMVIIDALHTLRELPFIRYDHRTISGKMIDDYLKRLKITPNVKFEVDGIIPITEMVSNGLGVSIVPKPLFVNDHQQAVHCHPLPSPVPHRTIGAMWMRSSKRARMAEIFYELVTEVLQNKSSATI